MPDSPSPKTLERWITESVRYTAFVNQKPKFEAAEVFQAIFGLAPATEATNFGVNTKILTASLDNITYGLSISPVRIDATASPDVSSEQIFKRGPIPNIGLAVERIGKAKETANQLLKHCSEVSRHAFGFVGYLPQNSVKDSYVALLAMLPSVNLDVENSSDFTYRINRPRIVRIEDRTMKINRLNGWQSIMMQVSGKIDASPGSTTLSEAFAVRSEIDTNTDKDMNLSGLTIKDHSAIVSVLAEFALEILASGDRK